MIILILITSRGSDWGEGGYIRLKRGVGMCGVGKAIATVSCEKVLDLCILHKIKKLIKHTPLIILRLMDQPVHP